MVFTDHDRQSSLLWGNILWTSNYFGLKMFSELIFFPLGFPIMLKTLLRKSFKSRGCISSTRIVGTTVTLFFSVNMLLLKLSSPDP